MLQKRSHVTVIPDHSKINRGFKNEYTCLASSQVTQQTESHLLCFAEEQAMGADQHRRTPRRSNRFFARGGAPDLPTAIVCPQAEAGADGG